MAYIGHNASGNFTTKPSKDTFSGDGSTTAFTLSEGATTNTVDVFVENVRQEPTTAYTVDGTTLTFTAAPGSGTNNIYVVNRGPLQLSATHPAAQALEASTGTFTGALSGVSATFTGDLTVDTNTLKVDSTNNRVGIGTTSPNESLEVNGNIFVNTSGNPSATIKTSGAGNNPKLRLQADSNYWDLEGVFSNATDDLFFGYNGSTKVAISNAGNVGIGTTSPLIPIQLNNYGGIDGNANQLIISNNTYYSGGDKAVKSGFSTRIDLTNQDGSIRFLNTSASSSADAAITLAERMRITSGGNVGIGEDVPLKELSVVGTVRVQSANGDTQGLNISSDTNGDAFIDAGYSVSDLKFGINSSERMRIDSSGNVGIGTTPA